MEPSAWTKIVLLLRLIAMDLNKIRSTRCRVFMPVLNPVDAKYQCQVGGVDPSVEATRSLAFFQLDFISLPI